MSETYVRNVIEAALLAAQRPVPLAELVQLFDESSRELLRQRPNGELLPHAQSGMPSQNEIQDPS